MMKTPADLQAFLQHMADNQAGCTHPNMTGVWPRAGRPRLVCFGCGFARTMTAQEVETRTAAIKESLK